MSSNVTKTLRTKSRTEAIAKQFLYFCIVRGQQMTPVMYYLPPSPPCRVVMLLGKMLGIDFDLKVINLQEGDQFKAEFVDVSHRTDFLKGNRCNWDCYK